MKTEEDTFNKLRRIPFHNIWKIENNLIELEDHQVVMVANSLLRKFPNCRWTKEELTEEIKKQIR